MSVKFSFDVPTPNLEDFEPYQDFHFCLGDLLKRSANYSLFYAQQQQKGLKQIWIDNGYNELKQSLGIGKLSDLADAYNARWVVAPDDPDWDTDEIVDKYTDTAEQIGQSKTICVVAHPQMAKAADTAGAKKLAISYHTRHRWSPRELEVSCNTYDVHYLGLLDPEELRGEHPPASCDTSMPIKLAKMGVGLKTWIKTSCQHIHTSDDYGRFFDSKLTDAQLELAIYNIQTLKEIVNG